VRVGTPGHPDVESAETALAVAGKEKVVTVTRQSRSALGLRLQQILSRAREGGAIEVAGIRTGGVIEVPRRA
jgi:hypothetical protein